MGGPVFSSKTQQLMHRPLNIGEIKDADGIGTAGTPHETTCMKMWIKVDDGVIRDAKFKIYGCLPNAATGSIVTERAKNKTLDEARLINEAQVLAELGGLPQEKKHCAGLAVECLHNALQDVLKNTGA